MSKTNYLQAVISDLQRTAGPYRCAITGREQCSKAALYSITSSASASKVGGNREAERLGGLEVDDELELGRRLHRKIGWLLALENTAGIEASLGGMRR